MICCLHKSNASCTRSMLNRSHLTLQCMISNRAFFCNWQISHLSLQPLRTAKQGMSRLAMPLSWMMLPGRRFTPAGVQAQRILDQLQQTPIVVRPLFLTRHIVLALTVPASPLSIEALLQPLSPPYWLCQDHRVLSRRSTITSISLTTTTRVSFTTITTSPPWRACSCLCHSFVASRYLTGHYHGSYAATELITQSQFMMQTVCM